MTKDDALLLFRKPRYNGNEVLCVGELFGVGFMITARDL